MTEIMLGLLIAVTMYQFSCVRSLVDTLVDEQARGVEIQLAVLRAQKEALSWLEATAKSQNVVRGVPGCCTSANVDEQ